MELNNGEVEEEKNWELMERVAPEVYNALDSIDRLYDTCDKLFGERTTYWGEGKYAELTTKTMIGCQQLMILKIKQSLEEMEKKYEIIKQHEDDWRFGVIEKDTAVFMNTAGDIAKLPCGIFKMIRMNIPIDLEIIRDGGNIKFIQNSKVIASIPHSLLLKINEEGIKGIPKELEC